MVTLNRTLEIDVEDRQTEVLVSVYIPVDLGDHWLRVRNRLAG